MTNRSKLFVIGLLIALSVVAIAIAMLVRGLLLTQPIIGECASLDQVPYYRGCFPDLPAHGISYVIRKRYGSSARPVHTVISGHASWDCIRRFCKAHELELSEQYPRAPTLRQKLIEYADGHKNVAVDFSDGDAFAIGRSKALGHIELHYRHGDGSFTMSIAN